MMINRQCGDLELNLLVGTGRWVGGLDVGEGSILSMECRRVLLMHSIGVSATRQKEPVECFEMNNGSEPEM